MSGVGEPVAFEVYEPGVYLHGTKAELAVGETLVSGRESNFEDGRVMNYVYFTATLDAATWGAELASGEGRGRIYVVEPTGEFEDDPNVPDKKFPGNPPKSFRSRGPLPAVREPRAPAFHPRAHRLGRSLAGEAAGHAGRARGVEAGRQRADPGLIPI